MARQRVGGSAELAREFGGTFIGQSRSDGTMATGAYLPEVAEEDERLAVHDRLRRFVPIEELPARPLVGQSFAHFARSARF